MKDTVVMRRQLLARFTLAVGFGVAAVPSLAAEWHKVVTAADGTTVFVGPVQGQPRAPVFWVKLDYSTKTVTAPDRERQRRAEELAARGMLACGNVPSFFCAVEEDNPAEAVQQWSIQCADRSLSVLATSVYNASGRVIRSSKAPTPRSTIVPDSIADAVAERVCGRP